MDDVLIKIISGVLSVIVTKISHIIIEKAIEILKKKKKKGTEKTKLIIPGSRRLKEKKKKISDKLYWLKKVTTHIKNHFRKVIVALVIIIFILSYFVILNILEQTFKEPQLLSIYFNLSNDLLQKRTLNENNEIQLASSELVGLNSLSGKAVFQNVKISDLCEIFGGLQNTNMKKIGFDNSDGHFSLPLNGQNLDKIHLIFKINHTEILVTIIITNE